MKAWNPDLRQWSPVPGLRLALCFALAAALLWSPTSSPLGLTSAAASDAGIQQPSPMARSTGPSSPRTVRRPLPAKPSAAQSRQPRAAQHTAPTPLHGKGAGEGTQKPNSRIAKAAHNHLINEPLPEVLMDSPIVRVAPGFEPGCGVDASYGIDASCGAEVVCGAEPLCGIEASCGTDPSYLAQESAIYCGEGCDTIGCTGCSAISPPPLYAIHPTPLLLPVLRIDWKQFEFFLGTQAFSGPMNFAGNGANALAHDGTASFGIQEGFNYSAPSYIFGRALSWQAGVRALQSNASGAEFTSDSRSQVFLTAGLFRRVDYGFQGGVVVDYMNDDWYYSVDMLQVRGQLSWMLDPRHEFGYGFMASQDGGDSTGTIRLDDGSSALVSVSFEPLDQHRFFYRWHFRGTGTFELFAGFSGESDGLLGLNTEIPLIDGLGLRTGFTYLNPDVAGDEVDNQEESWNLGLSFVWYPRGSRARRPYDRPMFEVADNGLMMVHTP